MNGEKEMPLLSAGADKQKVRPEGSRRHVVFNLKVPENREPARREPVSIALAIDRSGSMHGEKMEAARKAASRVIQAMDAEDRFSVVCFDEIIETLVDCAPADSEQKEHALSAVSGLQARGTTNLHTGWLTACRSIAPEEQGGNGVCHCFLLTDGLANRGETDPEKISSQAAEVRAHAGISTSTFGIGEDYDEALLAPMAFAGGGQFHHVREAGEIEKTFSGELAELFACAAGAVQIEIDADPGIRVESISDYHVHSELPGASVFLDIGSLMAGEERRAVVRVNVLPTRQGEVRSIRCRLHWTEGKERKVSDTGTLQFTGATVTECSREIPDTDALHWMGLHHAARTTRKVMMLLRKGRNSEARLLLKSALSRFRAYPSEDGEVGAAVAKLVELLPLTEEDVNVESGIVKEAIYTAQLFSRGQRDLRNHEILRSDSKSMNGRRKAKENIDERM